MDHEIKKHQPLKGFKRLISAWHNSRAGFKDIWRTEEAFRLEMLALLILTPLAFFISDHAFHAALLIASVIFVLIVEIINSAIEAAIDRIGPERHELSRIAKDLGSLAVLFATLMSGILWLTAALLHKSG